MKLSVNGDPQSEGGPAWCEEGQIQYEERQTKSESGQKYFEDESVECDVRLTFCLGGKI